MIVFITQLVVGYSLISAAILLIAYVFFLKDMRKTTVGLVACGGLLISLSVLQLSHWSFLATGVDLFASRYYIICLLLTPPLFYFFSREILIPGQRVLLSDVVHFLPTTLGFVVPASFIIPIALFIGAGYSVWLVRLVVGLRKHVRRYKFEVFFFGFFALVAILVIVIAIAALYSTPSIFFISYSLMTGLAFMLIMTALIGFPELLNDISAAAELAYAKSTLGNIDVDESLQALDRVMRIDKIFQNENLNLNLLSDELGLTPHQLSELINTHFGYGYSRYIREQRIAEAKRLLRVDERSSVLSISLMTGFKSQSNFYTAFREVTGHSPGFYRKH